MQLTITDLMRDWEQRTREHATKVQKATDMAFREAEFTGPLVADYLTLATVEIDSTGEGFPYSRPNREPGPWVRTYDPTANHGHGAYAWAKGVRVVPDHAVTEVQMAARGDWAEVQELARQWPLRPCSESLLTWSVDSDGEDGEDGESGETYCAECEEMVACRRDGDRWIRLPHTRDGKLIDADALA